MVVRSGLILGLMLLGASLGEEALAQHALASALPTDTTVRKATKPSREFSQRQLRHDRVLAARYEKRFAIKQLFRERNIPYPAEEVYIRIFKRERQLELWARGAAQDTFALLKRYEICALSDQLGPKRKQGDMQTPEGFYYIDDFNPRSGYHLSLHINYPNRSDQILGKGNLGGNIFIHGGCKTEGCMAVTDENIKEIYWVAVESRDNGQKRIPVHIFPARLTDNNLAQLMNVFHDRPDLVSFWTNLKPGYDYFAKYKALPEVKVSALGRYELATSAPATMLGTVIKSDSAKGN
ncbi:MAG TPA: L,D-transpeptidase family protein [Longimicrobiales bacterium]